ncbi:uncharacterized protein [Periplaneta americana]|uniref:uncharacterized protein n=1 Tax=Periplaneta americana TaxID=6978 RepID=UPI0037E79362
MARPGTSSESDTQRQHPTFAEHVHNAEQEQEDGSSVFFVAISKLPLVEETLQILQYIGSRFEFQVQNTAFRGILQYVKLFVLICLSLIWKTLMVFRKPLGWLDWYLSVGLYKTLKLGELIVELIEVFLIDFVLPVVPIRYVVFIIRKLISMRIRFAAVREIVLISQMEPVGPPRMPSVDSD